MIESRTYDVVVVGNYPPPIHGSAKNTAMLTELLQAHARVLPLNTSPGTLRRGPSYHVRKLWRQVVAAFRLVSLRKSPKTTLYFVPDHGLGKIYHISHLGIALLRGFRILFHHRTFAYVAHKSLLMALFVRATRLRATHVFLCETMAREFQIQYGPVRCLVVSNLAMNPDAQHEPPYRPRLVQRGRITLGLLSNLSEEKGLYDFIRTLDMCVERGLEVRGLLAGPVPRSDDETKVRSAVAKRGGTLEYLGPLHGEDKRRFFDAVDIFVFPTRYPVEAQPNVLFEALLAGCQVVSTQLGCIPEALENFGVSVPIASLPSTVAGMVEAWTPASRQSPSRVVEAQDVAKGQLRALLREIVGADAM